MSTILKKIINYQARELNITPSSSAVLVLLVKNQEAPKEILLLQRPAIFSSYAGDICFPGGVKETGDQDLQATAIRETYEEIGFLLKNTNIIGQCGDFKDSKNCLVRPFIGTINAEQLQILKLSTEVEKTYLFPLENIQQLQIDQKNIKPSRRKPSYIYQDKNMLIWGLTASILVHVGNIIYDTQLPIAHTCEH